MIKWNDITYVQPPTEQQVILAARVDYGDSTSYITVAGFHVKDNLYIVDNEIIYQDSIDYWAYFPEYPHSWNDKKSEDEVKKEVRTYRIHKMCKCGGEYLFEKQLSNCALHKCHSCGRDLYTIDVYPKTVYEEIEA